jgi:hypothetical protein
VFVLRKVREDASLLLTAERWVREDHVDAVFVADFSQGGARKFPLLCEAALDSC